MKSKTSLAILAALFFACSSVSASEKVNLSGTWKFDQDKSHSNGPGFDQTMTINHTGEKVKLDAKQKSPRGEIAISEEYTLEK